MLELTENGEELSKEAIKYLDDLKKKPDRFAHAYYKDVKQHADNMAVHSKGEKPGELLSKQRPNEPPEVLEYRKSIFQPVTKSLYGKVHSVMARIFNNRLYSFEFQENPRQNIIQEEFEIDNYLTKDYPFHKSLINFAENFLLKKTTDDPNAVVCIKPERFDIEDTEFFKPVPKIIPSENLMQFDPGHYYISFFPEQNDKQKKKGWWYVITDSEYYEIYDHGPNEKEIITYYLHEFGEAPTFRLGGIVCGDHYPYFFESFISGILPHWNKAILLQSDLDAGITNHLYLEKWEYDTKENSPTDDLPAKYDNDKGPIQVDQGVYRPDYRRHSGGNIQNNPDNPYQKHVINPNATLDGEQPPIPPAGYIEKNPEVLRFADQKVKDEKKEGLDAINMDIIYQVGENQSGVAKMIDRSDLDSFLLKISDHIYGFQLPMIIKYTMKWMYGKVLSEQQIEDYTPIIHKPVSFDVYSIRDLVEELNNSTNISPSFKKRIEIDLITKRVTDPVEQQKQMAIIDLNPLYGMEPNAVLVGRSNGVISKPDMYKYFNINAIVNRAIEEDDNFLDMEYLDKVEKVNELVNNALQEIEAPANRSMTPTPNGG